MKRFKACLIIQPQIKGENGELANLGKFTVGKKYLVYSIYSEREFTDFLVADDEGIFRWISITSFKR